MTLPASTDPMYQPLAMIADERRRQQEKWGEQRHSWPEWIAILTEEVGEAATHAVDINWRPSSDPQQRLVELEAMRTEMTQAAAVAVQILEHLDEAIDMERYRADRMRAALELPSAVEDVDAVIERDDPNVCIICGVIWHTCEHQLGNHYGTGYATTCRRVTRSQYEKRAAERAQREAMVASDGSAAPEDDHSPKRKRRPMR